MRRINPSSSFLVVLVLGLFLSACSVDNRSRVLDDFHEAHQRDLRSFYFYPSTIRTFAKLMGGDYETSLSELRECKVFLCWDADEKELVDDFKQLEKDILEAGFEKLGVMKKSGNRISMNVNDTANPPIYVLLIDNEDGNYVLELKGDISYKTLTKLSSMDFSSLDGLIDLGKPSAEEAQEEKNEPETEVKE
jgi:hypothetical protein